MAEKKGKNNCDAKVKISVEVIPTGKASQIKPYSKIIEFSIGLADLPIKVHAESSKMEYRHVKLAEETCED